MTSLAAETINDWADNKNGPVALYLQAEAPAGRRRGRRDLSADLCDGRG